MVISIHTGRINRALAQLLPLFVAFVPTSVMAQPLRTCSERGLACSYPNGHELGRCYNPVPPRSVQPRSGSTSSATANLDCLWSLGTLPGRRIRVGFLEGDSAVQTRVRAIAETWTARTGVPLNFVASGPAEVRIAFRPGESWSEIGSCANTAPERPTMNFGWLTPGASDEVYRSVVLHEFGHALGLLHEHMSPNANIAWNRPAVYAYYAQQQGWTREHVDLNVLDRVDYPRLGATTVDVHSIMMYPIPASLTTNGFHVDWNTVLSDTDVAFVRTLYGPQFQPTCEPYPIERYTVDRFDALSATFCRPAVSCEGPVRVVFDARNDSRDPRNYCNFVLEPDGNWAGETQRFTRGTAHFTAEIPRGSRNNIALHTPGFLRRDGTGGGHGEFTAPTICGELRIEAVCH